MYNRYVIDQVLKTGKRVKLLPFIENGFNNFSDNIIEKIKLKLDNDSIEKEMFNAGGITTWTFENGGKVKLLDSPCYDNNIKRCREYGELRLLPNFSLQKCIFDYESISIDGVSVEGIRNIISEMWQNFNSCM